MTAPRAHRAPAAPAAADTEAPLLADAPLDAAARAPGGLAGYVEALCDRIQAVEPRLRALLPEPGRRERLLRDAAALERRWPDPAARPPLFGTPVGVKDIIAVDGLPTRAGSMVPAASFAMPEAPVVARLRAAGALIVGKTVTTEFAYFDPGPTTNPHAPARTPGGSSSGSAAAVAAGIAALALGTQTVGSVIRPAAFCGVVGVKPSYGRVPSDGVLPYSRSVDTVGWFVQRAADAPIAARVLVDGWREAEVAAPTARRPVLGVPDGAYLAQAAADGLAGFERALDALRAAGYVVRRVPALDDIDAITARHRALTTREFAEVHAERFRAYAALFRPGSATLMDRAPAIDDDAFRAGLAGRGELRARLEALMAEHGVDAWASPAAPGPAPLGLGATGDPAMNLPWTHAGMPAVVLPAGAAEGGLPLGLQLCARYGHDEALLGWAVGVGDVLSAALPAQG